MQCNAIGLWPAVVDSVLAVSAAVCNVACYITDARRGRCGIRGSHNALLASAVVVTLVDFMEHPRTSDTHAAAHSSLPVSGLPS